MISSLTAQYYKTKGALQPHFVTLNLKPNLNLTQKPKAYEKTNFSVSDYAAKIKPA